MKNHPGKLDEKKWWLLLPCLIFYGMGLFSQTPFQRIGQFFLAVQNPNEVVEVTVNNALQTNPLGNNPGSGLDALGFRKTDNLLYGIHFADNHLFQIGSDGAAQDMGSVGLDGTLFYLAGDVSPDGKHLVSIGSDANGDDVHLAKTDLENVSIPTTFTNLNSGSRFADLAFDPCDAALFGYDKASRCMAIVNPSNGGVILLAQIASENEIHGLFFDAFCNLYAYGSSVFGIVDALFLIDKNTGKETRLATGAVLQVSDAASCPFSVEMKNVVEPEVALPCSEAVYTLSIANRSDEMLTGIDFEQVLPPGFFLKEVLQNPFGTAADTISLPGAVRFSNLNLAPGIKEIALKIAVSDVPGGNHSIQARLKNLPALYGNVSLSDNPRSARFEDSTMLQINRFEEDSLFFYWFVCHGESMLLDGSEYGNNIQWNTGATSAQLQVSQGGLFFLEAASGCQELFVSHDVTSASCPYTISMEHVFLPDTLFACSELTCRFILENDSGEERSGVSFTDTLPPGFEFLEIASNPFGGNLKNDTPANVLTLENMHLKIGADTLDILVSVGEIPPGNYKNRAVIFDLPQVMGPNRFSDFPPTLPADSTPVHILGAHADSLFLVDTVCAHSELTLDASHLGKTFLWEDGSSTPTFVVKQPGAYQLTLFDGCDPALVFWQIHEGIPIDVVETGPFFIHQGEQVTLAPLIFNQGNTLKIEWTDPTSGSLSCFDCLKPVAMPFSNLQYKVVVFNELCTDTTHIEVFVDESRRIYAPNAISPNGDGINDFFFLQSPDFGIIRRFAVFDRWGGSVFSSENSLMNVPSSGWDGWRNGKAVTEGVYLWWAEVEFVDGKREVFRGDIAVLR